MTLLNFIKPWALKMPVTQRLCGFMKAKSTNTTKEKQSLLEQPQQVNAGGNMQFTTGRQFGLGNRKYTLTEDFDFFNRRLPKGLTVDGASVPKVVIMFSTAILLLLCEITCMGRVTRNCGHAASGYK